VHNAAYFAKRDPTPVNRGRYVVNLILKYSEKETKYFGQTSVYLISVFVQLYPVFFSALIGTIGLRT